MLQNVVESQRNLTGQRDRSAQRVISAQESMEEILFLSKKITSVFVYPLGQALLLLTLALAVLLFKKSRWLALTCVCLGVTILLVFSIEMTSFHLLKSLENRAGHFQDPSKLEEQGVKLIVVMGGSIVAGGIPPAESWGPSILRVMEGIRLAKGIRDCKLVLSGASAPGRHSNEGAMALLALEMGMKIESLIIMTAVYDSEDEASKLSTLVGKEPFGLVTSAIHVPRSIKLFKKYGANPVACPCDFKTIRGMRYVNKYIPNAGSLLESHVAVHEYVGLLWINLKSLLMLNRDMNVDQGSLKVNSFKKNTYVQGFMLTQYAYKYYS